MDQKAWLLEYAGEGSDNRLARLLIRRHGIDRRGRNVFVPEGLLHDGEVYVASRTALYKSP